MRPTVYRFEAIGDQLELVPLAGRRALDRAGRKVGLSAWQAMPLPRRAEIVEAGASDGVDLDAVVRALEGVASAPMEAEPEPDPATVPEAVARLGVDAVRWRALGGLDRWALASLVRRGKDDAARALLAELG